MASFLRILSSFQEQMDATLTRTDVLKPLAWLLVILAVTVLTAHYLGLPVWFFSAVCILLLAVIVLYIGTYVYGLKNNPDLLRSEKYSLHKMAIERGLIGDDLSGTFDPKLDGATKQIEADVSDSLPRGETHGS